MTFIRLKKSYPRATKTRIVMNENALLWNPLYLSCWIPAGKKETESIPLNYRVYYKNKTIKYPLVYNLSIEDFDKLGTKRISDSLAEVKAKLSEIEFQAMVAARKIRLFDFEAFYKAKDFWFFSFYANGMNVKDIICLKYKNIKGDFLVFERAKTESTTRGGEPVVISCFINQDMLDIIERWGNKDKNPENYIFPVLKPGLSPIRQFEVKQNFTQ